MRNQGKITHWNEQKAYGFITPSSGAKQVFVHIRFGLRKGQTRCAGVPLAHKGKHTAHIGTYWWLAGRAYCPAGVAAQVAEKRFSVYVLDDGCSELCSFRMAFYSAGC